MYTPSATARYAPTFDVYVIHHAFAVELATFISIYWAMSVGRGIWYQHTTAGRVQKRLQRTHVTLRNTLRDARAWRPWKREFNNALHKKSIPPAGLPNIREPKLAEEKVSIPESVLLEGEEAADGKKVEVKSLQRLAAWLKTKRRWPFKVAAHGQQRKEESSPPHSGKQSLPSEMPPSEHRGTAGFTKSCISSVRRSASKLSRWGHRARQRIRGT